MLKKPVDHYEHPDKRTNNPTQELSGFAETEENAPTRYPRDAALDPQLVWKGKDQQNDTDLEVHTGPIYTQEHIQPQAIIENLRAQQHKIILRISLLDPLEVSHGSTKNKKAATSFRFGLLRISRDRPV